MLESYKSLVFKCKQVKERLLLKVDFLEESELRFRLIDLKYLMKQLYASATQEEKLAIDLLK